MKKLGSILLAFLTCSVMGTSLFADAASGQDFYLNQLKVCERDGIKTGGNFSSKLDRDGWEEAKEDGKLIGKWKEVCPSGSAKFDALSASDKENLYDFCWKFASDGDVPSCG